MLPCPATRRQSHSDYRLYRHLDGSLKQERVATASKYVSAAQMQAFRILQQ
jgi:hypothetical protein